VTGPNFLLSLIPWILVPGFFVVMNVYTGETLMAEFSSIIILSIILFISTIGSLAAVQFSDPGIIPRQALFISI
jgi:hypothetical protein